MGMNGNSIIDGEMPITGPVKIKIDEVVESLMVIIRWRSRDKIGDST